MKTDEFEVIREKVTYRWAQRPGSYVVTKFMRPVRSLPTSQTAYSRGLSNEGKLRLLASDSEDTADFTEDLRKLIRMTS